MKEIKNEYVECPDCKICIVGFKITTKITSGSFFKSFEGFSDFQCPKCFKVWRKFTDGANKDET